MQRKKDPNENKSFIYTEECSLCGHTAEYANAVLRLKEFKKTVAVKQPALYMGWMEEAKLIGLEMPFVFDYDTKHTATTEEIDKMTNEELKEWLGIRE